MSVEIWNLALTALGADALTSMEEDNENARRLSVIYVPVVKDLLRAHPWNFALKRATLAQMSASPDFGYTYFYQLPSDCLKVVEINDQVDIDYVVEGRRILCDEETVELRYISYITDSNQYDSNFVSLLSARLQAEIAYAVTHSRTLAKDKWDEYIAKRNTARSSDAQEGKPQKIEKSNWVSSRGSIS